MVSWDAGRCRINRSTLFINGRFGSCHTVSPAESWRHNTGSIARVILGAGYRTDCCICWTICRQTTSCWRLQNLWDNVFRFKTVFLHSYWWVLWVFTYVNHSTLSVDSLLSALDNQNWLAYTYVIPAARTAQYIQVQYFIPYRACLCHSSVKVAVLYRIIVYDYTMYSLCAWLQRFYSIV